MENIVQAVERAKVSQISSEIDGSRRRVDFNANSDPSGQQTEDTTVHSAYLLSKRIVTHEGVDQRSRPYDVLRTQVLRSMGLKGWTVLGVTSPTPGCGKTVTAINLALSIARQPDRAVVLVDLDLQKPQIASCLGLRSAAGGVLDLLAGRETLRRVAISVHVGNLRIVVLPTQASRGSSELMGSREMRAMLQDIRQTYRSHVIIVDLPPILSGDDVIAILPQIDCVLFVAAVGLSKASEVEECNRHLQSSHLVRVVVNKATDAFSNYYY